MATLQLMLLGVHIIDNGPWQALWGIYRGLKGCWGPMPLVQQRGNMAISNGDWSWWYAHTQLQGLVTNTHVVVGSRAGSKG